MQTEEEDRNLSLLLASNVLKLWSALIKLIKTVHITDEKLNIIDEGLNIVIHQDIHEILNLSSAYVINMHENMELRKEFRLFVEIM